MTLWFISDTHFGHKNILNFKDDDGNLTRPFPNVQEMDETMVEQWNTFVKPQDHIYHLGDVTMVRGSKHGLEVQYVAGLLKRLNGHKRLVLGNHDQMLVDWYLENGFEKVYGSRVLNNILFTHIPVHTASLGRFAGNVHGHIHERVVQRQEGFEWVADPRYVNVSVERTNYHPVSMEDLTNRLRTETMEVDNNSSH